VGVTARRKSCEAANAGSQNASLNPVRSRKWGFCRLAGGADVPLRAADHDADLTSLGTRSSGGAGAVTQPFPRDPRQMRPILAALLRCLPMLSAASLVVAVQMRAADTGPLKEIAGATTACGR